MEGDHEERPPMVPEVDGKKKKKEPKTAREIGNFSDSPDHAKPLIEAKGHMRAIT